MNDAINTITMSILKNVHLFIIRIFFFNFEVETHTIIKFCDCDQKKHENVEFIKYKIASCTNKMKLHTRMQWRTITLTRNPSKNKK